MLGGATEISMEKVFRLLKVHEEKQSPYSEWTFALVKHTRYFDIHEV